MIAKLAAASLVCVLPCFCQSSSANTAAGNKQAAEGKQLTLQLGDAAEFGPIGITGALAGPMSTVAGAPYSAEAVTQRVQILSDGNRIEQATSASVARDSQGRVRRDEVLPGLPSSNGDSPRLTMIEDPVAGLHWTLDAHSKTATKMPLPQTKAQKKLAEASTPSVSNGLPPPPDGQKVFFYSTSTPGTVTTSQIKVFAGGQSADSNVTHSDLGTQTVEGVPAQGTRTTRTLPAGTVGNQMPIVITTETWYSPDLKILVMSKTEDPRMGETTYKLTNLQRAEPAADQFLVPDGYTIKEQPTNVFLYQEGKHAQ